VGIEQRSDAGARLVPEASTAGAATMRAAVQHRYGPPSVLESSEVEIPSRYVAAGHTRGKVVITL